MATNQFPKSFVGVASTARAAVRTLSNPSCGRCGPEQMVVQAVWAVVQKVQAVAQAVVLVQATVQTVVQALWAVVVQAVWGSVAGVPASTSMLESHKSIGAPSVRALSAKSKQIYLCIVKLIQSYPYDT